MPAHRTARRAVDRATSVAARVRCRAARYRVAGIACHGIGPVAGRPAEAVGPAAVLDPPGDRVIRDSGLTHADAVGTWQEGAANLAAGSVAAAGATTGRADVDRRTHTAGPIALDGPTALSASRPDARRRVAAGSAALDGAAIGVARSPDVGGRVAAGSAALDGAAIVVAHSSDVGGRVAAGAAAVGGAATGVAHS